mgnify:CR=1 FL=1
MKNCISLFRESFLSPKFVGSRKANTGITRKQAGLAAVEFTLLLPLMLLFIAAIGEFGNVLIKYNTLSKAVQNGARLAVVDVYGTADPNAIASNEYISNAVIYGSKDPVDGTLPALNGLTVSVTQEGNVVTVSASYPYQALMAPLLDNIISENFVLTSSSVMRVSP